MKNNVVLSSHTNNGTHRVIIKYLDDEARTIQLAIQLMPNTSFFKRLSVGLKYIFTNNVVSDGFTSFTFEKKHAPFLMEIITKLNYDSKFIKHAIDELQIAGYFRNDKDSELSNLMAKDIIELLTVFSTHGHSGSSASWAISLFKDLAMFKTISPLTLEDNEFTKDSFGGGIYQNKRNSHIFKDNKGIYNIDAFVKKGIKRRLFDTKELIDINPTHYNGTIFESRAGKATGRGFRNSYFKQEDIDKKRIPLKTIVIPVIEIEVQKDDFLSFVDVQNKEYRELKSLQNIEYFDVSTLKGKIIIDLNSNHGY